MQHLPTSACILTLHMQAGELPNLRWQISVLVANIERLNNQAAGNAQPAAPCNQDQDQHHNPTPAPLPEPLKAQAASGGFCRLLGLSCYCCM